MFILCLVWCDVARVQSSQFPPFTCPQIHALVQRLSCFPKKWKIAPTAPGVYSIKKEPAYQWGFQCYLKMHRNVVPSSCNTVDPNCKRAKKKKNRLPLIWCIQCLCTVEAAILWSGSLKKSSQSTDCIWLIKFHKMAQVQGQNFKMAMEDLVGKLIF